MKKSRWILTLAVGVVVSGLSVGAVAYLGASGVEAQSPDLPATMAWLPANASVIGHVDLSSLFNSPLREKWEEQIDAEESRDELDEFREATGLDPFSDLYRASFAVVTSNTRDGSPSAESWGISIQGAFDAGSLINKLEAVADIEVEDYQGTTIYYPTPHEDQDTEHVGVSEKTAFAFADSDTIVVGDRDYIRQMLDTGHGRAGSAAPALNQSWGEGTFVNDTFWVAAAPENGFAGMLPEGGEIPPIHSLAFSGRLDADIALRARGLAADLASAIKLADVVRGFVALGSLQQGKNPDIGAILSSIQIDQFDNEVNVSLTVPYETLERLSQQQAEETEAIQN
ncbi:MAG: hypothetical protein BMS9Abin37_1455 [Acidobacteriota bacterium]|nr:MAG: hypothetical protein BMS9Abin37_1455 [Acidobacteriota bacterium]